MSSKFLTKPESIRSPACYIALPKERIKQLIAFAEEQAEVEEFSADCWTEGCEEAISDRSRAIKHRQIAELLKHMAI